jgi:hypothetical protein
MKRTIVILAGCFLALIVLFFTTDPNSVPSSILVLPFLLLFLLLLTAIYVLLQTRGVPSHKSLKIGALGAVAPLALLVLQSIGQLTVRDVLVLAALFGLSYFYISRNAATT